MSETRNYIDFVTDSTRIEENIAETLRLIAEWTNSVSARQKNPVIMICIFDFAAHTGKKVLERYYGKEFSANLFINREVSNNGMKYILHSPATFRKNHPKPTSVIAYLVDEDFLIELEDTFSIKEILLVPEIYNEDYPIYTKVARKFETTNDFKETGITFIANNEFKRDFLNVLDLSIAKLHDILSHSDIDRIKDGCLQLKRKYRSNFPEKNEIKGFLAYEYQLIKKTTRCFKYYTDKILGFLY